MTPGSFAFTGTGAARRRFEEPSRASSRRGLEPECQPEAPSAAGKRNEADPGGVERNGLPTLGSLRRADQRADRGPHSRVPAVSPFAFSHGA